MESLTPKEREQWPLAETIYFEHGSPTRAQRDQLLATMKEIVERCYISFVYKRYKQLERKEWPSKEAILTPVAAAPEKSEAQIIAEAEAAYSPEEFARWLEIRQQSKLIAPEPSKAVISIEKRRKAHG